MALNKQKVTDDGKKTTEKPKTQTVTVGGREISVPSSAPKTPTAPKTSNTSNVTVGGRELSQSQKNDKTVSNAIKNTVKSVTTSVANNSKAKVQQDNKTFVDNNRQYQQQGNNWANQRAEQSNPLTRNDFNTDRDYENYILDNKIDYTKGEAKEYLQQRSAENGTTSMRYMEGMRSRYKNKNETEKIAEKAKNGDYSPEKLADINNRFYALIDNDGNEVDIDTYNNEANMIDSTYDELNNRLKKIDKDYYDGKIDYQTRVNEYDRINALWNENTANAERLQSYKQVSGFDYYDWAKTTGKDVTDFEAYAENLNDNWFERLAQAYGASWWDTLATRPETLAIIRTALDPNYDIRDDKLSTSMRATANELREYAFAGSTGFEKWSVSGLNALMPMINEAMINQILPLEAIVGGYSTLTGTAMTAEQTAKAVGKLASGLTNTTLGIQTAGEVLRQRLDEGNNKLTALADASIHGVITAMVEGMDAGSTINFLTGGIGKHLATLSLFGKPSVLRALGNMAMAGHDEGKEEVIETTGVFLADTVLNAVSSVANSFGIDALQKVNVNPLNVADMANEYALAFFGTAVLGAPATAGDFITTKKQYNSIMKAREHFESVLNTPLASNLEKTVARKSIENIDYALGTSPVAESDVAKAVTTSEDFTEPLPTYDSLMNELANAMRPDVQDDIQRVQKTIDYSEYLRSQMQRELDERGLNSTVDRFMSTDNKTRDEIMRSSDFLNDNNINSFILKMKRGLNGARTEGGVLLNTDQTASYDIDKVTDMDDKEFDAKIDLDDSEMLRDAGIAPSMIRSAFHESSHWAEQSDLWLSVRNMVRDAMGAKRFDTFTNRIEKIYDKQGIEVENPETETVAFYLQKYLDDPKFLERMARYNSSFLNRFFSNAIAKLKGDEKIKLQNLYLDALRDAQNSATQELAPEYSVSSLFQAIGMTIHKESEVYNDDGSATTTFYAEDENGNKVREVTEEMVKDSPLGQMLQEAQDRGFIEDSNNQVTMVATIYNSILKSQDPEMFWAVFGSIGFGRAHVGTSSWDVSRPQHFASFTTNSDPQYGHTFDVTTICTKTQQLIDVASETMKRLNRGLTEDEVIDVVYNEVFKAGEPVPCPVCYVFSRWVGIGGVLENIKNFQEKYKGANLDELRDRYEVLSKQVDEISEKRGIRGSKAIEELRKQTDQEVVDRYETLFGQEIVERMGGKKLTAEERAEFESLKKDLEVLNDWAWLTRVVLDVKVKKGVKTIKVSKDYVEIGDVPNEILFDLNKGEDFAKYPAWKYRASRGQRYGKIIAPYSDMVLGQTIMGFANPSDSSIKSLGQKRDKKSNAFLDMKKVRKQNQLYDKAVANARVQNLKNGSRAQSTSDFRFEYITDYILHFMQLQSIGSYGQTYTKVPEAVPVLCSVGYEVNMSLMPKGKGYKPAKKGDPYAYYVEGFDGVEDGWYTIDCSSVTGINPDVAFYLRTQYDNAQTIMVGINDVHLFLCRQDPRVDFIIPYHASGGSAEHYASMMNTVHEGADLDANDRVDYSEVSNENEEDLPVLTEDQKYARELREKILTQNLPNPTEEEIRFMQQGTGILWNLWNRFYVEGVDDRCYEVNMGKKPAIFPYEYWDETSTRENADVNGMRYVQYCKELGYKPKFESLSNGDGSGGYWKCLPDRSMYNVDGTSHIQKAINMDNFSSDFLYKGKIQEGIVQPIAEQENVPLDENDPRYQELRKRVLSQQFNKEKTMPIVDDVVKRIKDGKVSQNRRYQFEIGEGFDQSDNEITPTSVGGNDIVPPNRVDGEVVDGYGEQKTQRFASSNIPKSDIFNEEQQERVREEIEEGLFSYNSLSNKVEVQRAREYMERDGIDKTFESFMSNNSPTVKSAVQGEVLLQELAKNNDPRWHDVAEKMADDGTILGQALQAYSIMQRLTPEGQLRTVQRNMRRLQQQLEEQYGRNAPQLEIKPELADNLANAKTAEEAEKARDAIQKDLISQMPITISSMIDAWRYLAMLGNPRTHVRNILGNAIFSPIIDLKNAIATVMESAFGGKLEYRTKAILTNSEADKKLLDFGGREYDGYKSLIEKKQKYERKSFTEKTVLGKALNKLSNWNSDVLDAEDFYFTKRRYAKSFAQFLKANNLTEENITAEMRQRANAYALLEAEKATFRDANAVASWLNELEKSGKKGMKMASYIKKAVLPFTKTPMNIIKRGVRYSPAGLVGTIAGAMYDTAKGKEVNPNKLIDNLASGMSGTAVALLGVLLTSMGFLRTKDDDNDRKNKFDAENGEQDYSLDLSWLGLNGTYTIDWMSPAIMPLAMGSEFYKALEDLADIDGVESVAGMIAGIVSNLMDPVVETTMLSSLKDTMKSYSTSGADFFGDVLLAVASNYVQQLFPSLGGQIARTIDDTRRTTYPNKGFFDKTMRQIRNKIPFLSKLNEPYINKQGQEEKTEGGNWFGRLVLNTLSPGYYSSKDIDEYDNELYRLYGKTGEASALPSSTSSALTYDNHDYKFSPEEYTEWHKTRYATETKYVNSFIDSAEYKNLSDEEKVATIKDIRSYAQLVAKKQFLESKGYIYTDDKELAEKQPDKYVYDKQLTNVSGALDNGIELYSFYDYLNNAGTKQAEKVQYLSGTNLSQAQKDYLWSLSGYKTSYADVYRKVMGGGGNSSSKKKKSSSKSKNGSSKKVTGVSAGGINKARGGGTTGKLKASPMASNPDRGKSIANNYFRAYANTFRRGSKNVSSASGNTVVCPRCGNRVSSASGRCPICGQSL
jgi:hypothetical protein